jgi:hypothetical protein
LKVCASACEAINTTADKATRSDRMNSLNSWRKLWGRSQARGKSLPPRGAGGKFEKAILKPVACGCFPAAASRQTLINTIIDLVGQPPDVAVPKEEVGSVPV